MSPDYDLSDLPSTQVDLWFYLQVDTIMGQILTHQGVDGGSPLALGAGNFSALTEKVLATLNSN